MPYRPKEYIIKKVGKSLQLNVTTDYGMRVLLALHQKNGMATADEISETMGISRRYLTKVTQRLKESGLIDSISGPTGGYRLLVPISEITVGQVCYSMEQTMKINRCMDQDGECSRHAKVCCPVRKFYFAMQKHLEQQWFSVSLQEILEKY